MSKRKKRSWKPVWAVSSGTQAGSQQGGMTAQTLKKPISLPVLEGIYGKDASVYYLAGCLYVNGEIVRVRKV